MSTTQPSILENPGRIIVIGDIHGDIDRLLHIFVSLHIFSPTLEWIAEPRNTVVIQLGDQIDSMDRTGTNDVWDYTSDACKDGILDLNIITLMDKLDSIAVKDGNGGRILSLIGNHEMLNLMHNFSYVSPCSMNIVHPELRKELFARGTGHFTHILAKRNVIAKIGKFIFCHAGVLPLHLDILNNIYGNVNVDAFNTIFRKFVLAEHLTQEEQVILNECILTDNGILWTRAYMELLTTLHTIPSVENAFDNILTSVLETTNCIGMFIGHNTVPTITGVLNKLYFVDAALSRAYNTNKIQVIELFTKDSEETVINLIEIPCC